MLLSNSLHLNLYLLFLACTLPYSSSNTIRFTGLFVFILRPIYGIRGLRVQQSNCMAA